jgi:ABC-type dipeptide/oligopeptide/nickel transport system ATPase subunit
MEIFEVSNDLPIIKPVKEKMNIVIESINPNLPNRNGFIYGIIAPPGGGKTSLLLSLFRSKHYYKKKFTNVYLITPENSFISVLDHPFEGHDKVYHDLNEETLQNIYDELMESKKECIDEDIPIENSCLIIDDFASELKNINLITMLKRFCTKSRHLSCCIIFTLQAYNLFPLVLRKMLTNITLFKPKNKVEVESIRRELINMNQDDTNELLNYVFDEEYNHLDIDTMNNQKRKNFRLLEFGK